MKENFKKSQLLIEKIIRDNNFFKDVEKIKKALIKSIREGGKIMICGNGGSATQASHMTGELVGKFSYDRDPLPAISLFDLAATSAIGNDYGYDKIFSRFIASLGKKEDILFSISTSGNSKNCIEAINIGKSMGLKTISLLGKNGGKMKNISDFSITVESQDTPLIQEIHLSIIHYLCKELENHFFKK